MSEVSDICEKLGRKALASRLGVGLTAVSNAAVLNKFPAKWYRVVREMCDAESIDLSDEMFSFTEPAAGSDPVEISIAR